jgi:hypothetical protein
MRPTRPVLVGAGGVVLVLAIAGVVFLSLGDDADALLVTHEWVEARNDGDIETVFRLLADDARVFDFSMANPQRRDDFADLVRVQQAMGWQLSDSDCVADDDLVTCRYEQGDMFTRALGVSLVGTHRYLVRDGLIVSADRVHDAGSRPEAARALNQVRLWVREHHPELEDVIWVKRRDIGPTTVEGVEALESVFDDYLTDR